MQHAIPTAAPWRGAALLATMFAVLASMPACAQTAAPDEVTSEIENKSDELDVPFVPSHSAVLDAMFDMAKPTKDDFVIDLGSGDGRIVIEAARRFGAQGFGVDLNEGLVRVANARAAKAGVAERAKFHVRNLFDTDIGKATVLTMYLLPEIVQELRPRIVSALKPGARVVSHDYHMGEWRPDEIRLAEAKPGFEDAVVYFWTVPARVAGRWEWSLTSREELGPGTVDYSASVRQSYQDIDGRLEIALLETRLRDPRIEGKRIRFHAVSELNERIVRQDFDGVVDGDRIAGTVTLSGGIQPVTLPWTAQRTGAAD